jgi:hypothetical protein
MQADLIWTLVGFFLTLFVLSYLLGDNPLFRLTTYLFIGVTAGYVTVVVFFQVILARLVYPLIQGDINVRLLTLVPLVLSALLLTRLSSRLTNLGGPSMAYLVGAGAALIIGGAVIGTLIGQTRATINLLDLPAGAVPQQTAAMQITEGLLFLVGTAATLLYFHFGASTRPDQTVQRSRLVEVAARVGQVFIAITLGSLFAGVYASTVVALIDRISAIRDVILALQNLVSR